MGPQPLKLIHLTDLHIAPDGKGPALEGSAAKTARAVDIINRDHGDAELCVVTGDLVYDPDPVAYDLAQSILSRLTMPTVSLIGNHDDRAMALARISSAHADGNGFVQSVLQTSYALVVTLDTKDNETHAGTLCEDRLQWLDACLGRHTGPVWLFMHHAPFATGLPAMDTIGLAADAALALEKILSKHANVAHLFFGHYHRPMSGVWNGIPFSTHRSMMLQCAMDLKTKTHVSAIFEEPQFAIITADSALTVVHYHDFDSSADTVSFGAADGNNLRAETA